MVAVGGVKKTAIAYSKFASSCVKSSTPPLEAAQTTESESRKMSNRLPKDVAEFLYELGTCDQLVSGPFKEYIRTAATLLWERYVFFEDTSNDITPQACRQFAASLRRRQN